MALQKREGVQPSYTWHYKSPKACNPKGMERALVEHMALQKPEGVQPKGIVWNVRWQSFKLNGAKFEGSLEDAFEGSVDSS